MLVSRIKEEDLTDELLDRLLFEGLEDTGVSADCAVVLGSSKAVKYRVPVAAELYHAGRVGSLMMCGGAAEGIPEALQMKEKAVSLGVPEKAVLTECSSLNTVENILYSMTELQRAFWLNRVKSLLLVTTAFHMRRSLAIARYLYPAHIQVYPSPAQDNHTRRHNWMLTEKSRGLVLQEAKNLILCAQNGVFPDFKV